MEQRLSGCGQMEGAALTLECDLAVDQLLVDHLLIRVRLAVHPFDARRVHFDGVLEDLPGVDERLSADRALGAARVARARARRMLLLRRPALLRFHALRPFTLLLCLPFYLFLARR